VLGIVIADGLTWEIMVRILLTGTAGVRSHSPLQQRVISLTQRIVFGSQRP
jgi:hypothetical protein